MGWTFVYLMLILKIPIVALLTIVWWAIRSTPEDSTSERADDNGGSEKRKRPRPPPPTLPPSPPKPAPPPPAPRPARGPAATAAAAHAHRRRPRAPHRPRIDR